MFTQNDTIVAINLGVPNRTFGNQTQSKPIVQLGLLIEHNQTNT